MAKIFYTERDIEDLARQGVTSLVVGEDIVVTDAARERARKLGFQLTEGRPASALARPYISEIPSPAASMGAMDTPSGSDLEARVYAAVKAKLGDQVDDALLRTIVKRVLKSLGKA